VIKNSKFIVSAAVASQLPEIEGPEICFCGRSNVGKSSLLNAVCGNGKLAMVSQKPGKTRLLNLFSANNGELHWVDLPGFGFAHVPQAMRKQWRKEIETYLLTRKNLSLILHLVDVRHEPTELDREFMVWLAENRLPFANVLTKADKLGVMRQKEAVDRLKEFHQSLNIEVPVVLTSSEKKQGIFELHKLIRDFTSGKFEIVEEEN
jgi:GTP-binding protein